MKILYIGNFLDGTGWGNACQNIILALDSVGVSVAPRPITFNGYAGKQFVNPRITELMDNDLSNVDTVIQHCFPEFYSYESSFQNIGMFYSETKFIPHNWKYGISYMDKIIVPCKQMVKAIIDSNIPHKEIHTCGIPIQIQAYQYDNFYDSSNISELKSGSFNFCFVGELTKRKNLPALLKAYHTEFHPSENVNLFLQVNVPGETPQQTLKNAESINQGVTDGLGLREKYKKVIISAGKMEHKSLLSILSQCHYFVCPSYGEAWCIPALEAQALGLPVIYTKGIGTEDFTPHGFSVNSSDEPCYGAINSKKGIYESTNFWKSISISDLQYVMRSVYDTWRNDNKAYLDLCKLTKSSTELYDYNKIGQKLKEIICL